jgi:hypothetical protein
LCFGDPALWRVPLRSSGKSKSERSDPTLLGRGVSDLGGGDFALLVFLDLLD